MHRRTVIRAESIFLALAIALVSPGRAAPADAGQPKTPGREVATVNGEPIRHRDLQAAVEADRKRRYLGADLSPSERRFLEQRALERLIGRELLYQAAKKEGMKVSRRVLNEQIAAARPASISDEVYQKYLEQAGMTEKTLLRRLEFRLLSDAYAQEVTDRVEVRQADARQVYAEDRDRFGTDEQLRCSHIVILVPPGAPESEREEARARIEQIREEAVRGADFGQLAREYSDSPLADQGGNLGFLARGRMRPEFDSVVFETPVGGITPVFETAYGFNLAKVLERREAVLPSFEEVRASLMMHLSRQRKHDELQRHIRKLWDAANVVILVPELAPVGERAKRGVARSGS